MEGELYYLLRVKVHGHFHDSNVQNYFSRGCIINPDPAQYPSATFPQALSITTSSHFVELVMQNASVNNFNLVFNSPL